MIPRPPFYTPDDARRLHLMSVLPSLCTLMVSCVEPSSDYQECVPSHKYSKSLGRTTDFSLAPFCCICMTQRPTTPWHYFTTYLATLIYPAGKTYSFLCVSLVTLYSHSTIFWYQIFLWYCSTMQSFFFFFFLFLISALHDAASSNWNILHAQLWCLVQW